MILVDTSVLVNYFRSKQSAATKRLESIVDTQLCITPIVFQELLQGARDLREFDLLKESLSTQLFCFPIEPVATHERAAKLFFLARRQGITVRSTIDCLIAQIAIDNDIPLLHDDQDFEGLAKVSKLRFF